MKSPSQWGQCQKPGRMNENDEKKKTQFISNQEHKTKLNFLYHGKKFTRTYPHSFLICFYKHSSKIESTETSAASKELICYFAYQHTVNSVPILFT